jgi:phage tail protein X
MADFYSTVEGDRIDQIVYQHYGSLDMLDQVLTANLHLTKKTMSLEAGITIVLPDAVTVQEDKTSYEVGTDLW